MATNTYVAIESRTLTTSTPSVTFTSIPQTYTDLVLVVNGANTASDQGIVTQVGNGSIDTGANYGAVYLLGSGSGTGASGTFVSSNYIVAGRMDGSNSTSIINYMNYSNTTTHKSVLGRGNNGTYVIQHEGTWRNTAAINTLSVFNLSSVNFAAGCTFTLYGIKAWSNTEASPKATGGYVYGDTNYWYHVFPFSSTFTPNQSLTCDYLVVAGGGAGGGDPSNRYQGGGGGAGGLRSTVGTTGGGGTLESALSLTAQAYTITVGAGGAGSTTTGANGTNSTLSTITATGGGGGGDANESGTSGNGLTGGSGGGSGSGPSQKSAGSGTTNQGYAGGLGINPSGGGGGGGAGGTPAAAITGFGGNGGNGVAISLLAQPTKTGVNYYYAAGGGGGGESIINPGFGGLGGGGNGGKELGYGGISGTGSGGGGAGTDYASSKGGNGGSGLVIVRYTK